MLMRESINQQFVRLALLGVLCFNFGCALRVKVRENWNAAQRTEVSLREATVTWQQIKRGELPSPKQLRDYNTAVLDSVVQIGVNWAEERPLSVVTTTDGEVEFAVQVDEVLSHQSIDQIIPADFVRVKRGFDSDVIIEGVGAPLIARQPKTWQNQMIPESGLWFPVTALLNLDQPSRPVLELIDPTRQRSLSTGHTRFPIAANYTASFARDFFERQRLIPDLGALLKFEKYADRMGLHRVSSFDPDKQVCVLIHGIYSSPSTWEVTINKFYEDPEIRERYEFWTFGYPTGALIPYLSAELRDGIREMKAFRARGGARDQSLVLVGHSMGGLLAKSMTQSGGDKDWNRLFKVPIEDLEVLSEYRETLRRIIYYEPVPNIEKVILCSTPHRGSRVASKPGGKMAAMLVQVPVKLAQGGSEILNDAERSLTPLGWQIAKGKVTSINQLQPGSALMQAYLSKPLDPSVRYFSVIGSKFGKKDEVPLEKVTDGVVDYLSAHIAEVEEEVLIYKMPHGLHREPEGIAEISRILKLP